jgi:alkylhydroperoxidase/carboxymuconolactone decarboxylase family protein YurZ
MSDGNLTQMEIMTRVSPVAARTYMDRRHAVMDSPDLQALPLRTTLRVGIGVAAALQSTTCTPMRTKLARNAGACNEEIAEPIVVSRLMKTATVNDTAADALAWLAGQLG